MNVSFYCMPSAVLLGRPDSPQPMPGDMPMQIAVWPDGTWCEESDMERHQREAGLSDDYAVCSADSDEHAEQIADRVQRTGYPDTQRRSLRG